jgi:hypothetical protein
VEPLIPRIQRIVERLRDVIAAYAAKHHAEIPLYVAVWSYLGRALGRFERLHARWQAGTLPKPRKPRPRPATPRVRKPPIRPLPPNNAKWRWPLLHHGNVWILNFEALLARPDLQEFAAAAPQLGRILRPLCRRMAIPIPAFLALPPRPPRPKPVKPTPPKAPPQPQGKYPRFRIQTYSPGRIPDFSKRPA